MQEIETILYCNKINEGSADKRLNVGTSTPQGHVHIEPNDWKMWSASTFGKVIAKGLSNIGTGYTCEVTDMGKAVSIRMGYHNAGNGKGIEKTYIILFDKPDSPDGTVFTSMSKWRTFNNYNQAISYITSSIKSYVGQTNSI